MSAQDLSVQDTALKVQQNVNTSTEIILRHVALPYKLFYLHKDLQTNQTKTSTD